jgi:hypothetical protein
MPATDRKPPPSSLSPGSLALHGPWGKVAIPAGLVLALLGGFGISSQIPTSEALDIRDLKRDVAEVKSELREIKSELRTLDRKRRDDFDALTKSFDRRTRVLERVIAANDPP